MTVADRTETSSIEDTIESAEKAIASGTRWLKNRIGPDGHPGCNHGHYYRVPWALAITGNRTEAAAVLSWVEREALDGSGDLKPGAPRSGFETKWASYPLTNLATGAWHLERYDTARRITERLVDFQHPETGGAFAGHPDHREDARQDLFPTAQLGMTGLTTGARHLADGAYNWLGMIYEAQPELPGRLYSATQDAELILDPDEELEWQVVTDFSKPRQAFYNPGIAAAFLGRYYMATGDEGALQLARDYLDLTVQGSDVQFDYTDSVQVCKFGWGSSILLEATGEDQYLEHTLSMGQWFCDAQNDDGSWDNSPFLMERAADRDSVRVEITAEFVQHLVTIVTALGGRART